MQLLCLVLIISVSEVEAQSKFGKNNKMTNTTMNRNIPLRADEVSKCKPMDIRQTETILRDRVGKTLKMRLDKNDGYVEILGQKQGFAFTQFTYDKPGHNWRYFLQDMNSIQTSTSYSKKHYYLNVLFESDRAEIKGRCPGCLNRFEDSRAPDIQWRNPKIKIKLKPVAYNDSFTFDVVDVNIEGKFETNGAIKAALPSIITHFKRQIKKAAKSQVKKVLNSDQVKRMLANAFKPEIRSLGMSRVRLVDMSKSNIYLCQ